MLAVLIFITSYFSHEDLQPFEHVLTWVHVMIKNISATTVSIATKPDMDFTMTMTIKLGRVVTYNEELPSIKSQGPSITWFFKVVSQINALYFSYHKVYDHYT